MSEKIHKDARRCTFHLRPHRHPEAECALTHCVCGTHDSEEQYHTCPPMEEGMHDDPDHGIYGGP